MRKIFVLGFAVAAALSACAPQRGPLSDITSSEQVCVDSYYGEYCKGPQGNLISGPQLLAGDY